MFPESPAKIEPFKTNARTKFLADIILKIKY
jgi:hypothetical protein